MSQREHNPERHQTKDKMLEDLQSLSDMLDEEIESGTKRPVPEDIPVLKSFVEDVPVLSESLFSENQLEAEQVQKTDSVDRQAGQFRTSPSPFNAQTRLDKGCLERDRLDMSFLDKDPLEISDRVRGHSEPVTPPQPSAPPAPQPHALKEGSSATTSGENPFLPRSTMDKLRANHARNTNTDASDQLRQLLQNNPLGKMSFDTNPSSKEFQALRQKASQLVNEVIRSNLPRLEAELRMKLEQEVDRMFRELKKK